MPPQSEVPSDGTIGGLLTCCASSARHAAELEKPAAAGKPDRNAMDRLTDDERRALELLAGSAKGVSETLLVTRFTFDTMVGLQGARALLFAHGPTLY
jgi:hypothetical protein